tara:strand:+ start:1886 stop:2569 length:684 start_codon:yes stop_codon:yes gene_type:complete
MKKINNYIVVIPCRKGSKRLKNKNTKKFKNKKLYQFTVQQSLRIFEKKNIIVSTDDPEIINYCKLKNISFTKRSKLLSLGKITSMQLLDSIKKKIKIAQNNYIYLQVTSPLRRDKDIRSAIKIFERKKTNCLISVTDTFVNPLWCNSIKNNSMYNFVNKKIGTTQSQKLPKSYQINGSIFIIKSKYIDKNSSFYQIKSSIPFYMSKRYSIDIDDKEDFEIAEKLYTN